MSEQPLRVSVIVEWENVLAAAEGTGATLIRSLARQARALRQSALHAPAGSFLARLREPVEVLVVVGDDAVDVAGLRSLLTQLAATHGIAISLHEAPGLAYYELKNFGARRAEGDLLVLLDSDVAPHDDWFQRILEPFADDAVQVVGGNAYIAPTSLLARAFASFWLFDEPATDAERLREARTFFANNVVFRRDLLLEHPFPAIPGTTRGSCRLLAAELIDSGVPVYKRMLAQVAHPPPHGLRQFGIRALAHGRDSALYPRRKARSLARRIWRDLKRIPNGVRSVLRARRRLGLRGLALVAASGLAVAYYTLFFIGAVCAELVPRRVSHAWRI